MGVISCQQYLYRLYFFFYLFWWRNAVLTFFKKTRFSVACTFQSLLSQSQQEQPRLKLSSYYVTHQPLPFHERGHAYSVLIVNYLSLSIWPAKSSIKSVHLTNIVLVLSLSRVKKCSFIYVFSATSGQRLSMLFEREKFRDFVTLARNS